MKRTTKMMGATVIVLAGFLYTPAADPATVFAFRDKAVGAYFTSTDGCFENEVYVTAGNEVFRYPPFENSAQSLVDVFIIRIDSCNAAEVIFADGFRQLGASDFQVDSRLDTATLNSTVTAFNYATSENIQIDINLTWTATSPADSGNSVNHYERHGCLVTNQRRGTERRAVASGSVSYAGTNLTPSSDPFAWISMVQVGFVYASCN